MSNESTPGEQPPAVGPFDLVCKDAGALVAAAEIDHANATISACAGEAGFTDELREWVGKPFSLGGF